MKREKGYITKTITSTMANVQVVYKAKTGHIKVYDAGNHVSPINAKTGRGITEMNNYFRNMVEENNMVDGEIVSVVADVTDTVTKAYRMKTEDFIKQAVELTMDEADAEFDTDAEEVE